MFCGIVESCFQNLSFDRMKSFEAFIIGRLRRAAFMPVLSSVAVFDGWPEGTVRPMNAMACDVVATTTAANVSDAGPVGALNVTVTSDPWRSRAVTGVFALSALMSASDAVVPSGRFTLR